MFEQIYFIFFRFFESKLFIKVFVAAKMRPLLLQSLNSAPCTTMPSSTRFNSIHKLTATCTRLPINPCVIVFRFDKTFCFPVAIIALWYEARVTDELDPIWVHRSPFPSPFIVLSRLSFKFLSRVSQSRARKENVEEFLIRSNYYCQNEMRMTKQVTMKRVGSARDACGDGRSNDEN